MKKFLHNRSFFIGSALLVILIVVLMLLGVGQAKPPELVTATVEKGQVRQLVSVSGIAEAKQTAELSFPVVGVVESVTAKVGDVVEVGDILAQLDTRALQTDRQDAAASLARAGADKSELVAGPQQEARVVTSETLRLKREALATTKINEETKVTNAKRALLSAGLTAYSDDPGEDALAPQISGTYTCDDEGTYTLQVYASGGTSGYSYRLSGIETGTHPASTEQAIPLGACGLRIKFDDASVYSSTTWYVEIPNTKSSEYTANLNAYDFAATQAKSAIRLAEQEVAVAEATALNTNAPARSEAVTRANADISQAQAKLARIDAEIADRVLRAPFSGTITEINIATGETVTTAPIMTLLANKEFEVTARVPEIDIGKLLIGQSVEMQFDARTDEILTGTISFISLKATEIDGVSYYEAFIQPNEIPPWVRSGLNADIDIIIQSQAADALRIPKRFLLTDGTSFSVLKQTGTLFATTTIGVTLEGNDGFVAITGLNEGDVVVAP